MRVIGRFILLILLVVTGDILIAQKDVPVYLDENKTIEERIEHALSLMTIEEKVAMTHAQSKFSSAGVPRLGIPEIWMSDGPHGVRYEISFDAWSSAGYTTDFCTAFPALTCLAATFNPEMSAIYGKALGEETRFRKKEVIFGPGINIYRTPLNGRNFEYLGEDPFLASKMVVPYIQGVQQNGVAACVKHFVANNQEKYRKIIDVQMSDRAFYEIYAPAFKAAVIEGKAWTLMGGYNKFRGEYCCHNDFLLNKLLKEEWGFDGVVISDYGGVHDTYQAVNNGLDIEMGTLTDGMTSTVEFAYNNYYMADKLLSLLKNGDISEDLIDDKVRRILRLIFRTSMNPNRPWGNQDYEEHAATCRKIGEEGIVLLKNENNILPINATTTKRILVVGENATRRLTVGGGSSELKVKNEVSPLVGLETSIGNDIEIVHSLGYASGSSKYKRFTQPIENIDSLHKVAVELAKDVDLVVYFGGLNKNFHQDTEGGDRKTMDLPFNQDLLLKDLIEANKNIVVVLLSGNAVSMPWINKVPGLLQAWYLGSEAGNSIASVLTGETCPSGKLPFSFPVKLTDNATHSFDSMSYPGDGINQFYKEDILVGYRWHDTKQIEPLFPFGYGLSYTSFDLGNATTDKTKYSNTDKVELKVPITNTGKLIGSEVIQVYISDNKASVLRPEKELKGFRKVKLNPGERKLVKIELPVSEWAFYSETEKNWVIEPGKFTIQLGTSSRSIHQQITVFVE